MLADFSALKLMTYGSLMIEDLPTIIYSLPKGRSSCHSYSVLDKNVGQQIIVCADFCEFEVFGFPNILVVSIVVARQ